MFKPATAGPAKIVTANRLSDGRVVFLTPGGEWDMSIGRARPLADGVELETALAYGQAQAEARVVVEPYAIDVRVGEDGVPVPVRLRERIRAEGPTVAYGAEESRRLTAAA